MTDVPIRGPNDDPGEPEEVCTNCGARYYQAHAADECCGRLIADGGQDTCALCGSELTRERERAAGVCEDCMGGDD
jgi:rRNA maturation endonuclease Nob1